MNGRTRTVFISYSHRDEQWKDLLVNQLRVVARGGNIDVWHDRRIAAGDAWKLEIEEAIARADIAILLISADFLNSPFIQEEEVGRILKLRATKKLRVIPLIVRPCAWESVEWLSDLQARPKDGRALSAVPQHQAEADLAALARELFPRWRWLPVPVLEHRAGGIAVSFLPAMVVGALIVVSMAIRVATPVQLDIVARSVSFTVGGETDKTVQLLNSSTPFSRLVVEQCEAVSFPPLVIGADDAAAESPGRTITLRCDPRIPGSKVIIGARRAEHATRTESVDIGTLGRIIAKSGDRVALALTAANPLEIWLDVSRKASFDFAIQKDVPFEIVSEFAEREEGASAGDIETLPARLAPSSPVRLATVDVRRALSLGIEPARDSDVEELFLANVDIPVESLSLFERSATDDQLVSTAISGMLTYLGRADLDSVPIAVGNNVRLGSMTTLRLTQLKVDREQSGLWFQFQGNATEVSTGSEDRRLTLLDRTLDTNMKLVAAAAAIAIQWAWLRRRRLMSLE